jgi:hypothetical protein
LHVGDRIKAVPTFIELLEETATAKPVISIPADEVDRLVQRFGSRVRQMGRWNVSTNGSLDIPVHGHTRSGPVARKADFSKTFLTKDQAAFGQKI